MTWISPLTGLFLALAVIPPLVLLYFLKLRRKPQTIASTLLWKRSVEDLQANAPFQKLRRNLLLFLQLLVLLLLVLSVMQPQVQGGEPSGRRVVLFIDHSASMNATDTESGRSRLEEAKRLARERIERLYAGGIFGTSPGETMIIAFADEAEIYSRFTDSRAQLLAAIDRIEPTDGTSRIEQAFALARAYTTNPNPDDDRPVAAPADFELYSDGRIQDLDAQVLRGEEMTYTAIGSSDTTNLAIGSIAVERPYDRPDSVEVFTALLNFGLEPQQADVQLRVDGTVLAIQEVDVPAGQRDPQTGRLIPGRNNIVFVPFEQPEGAVIDVMHLTDDALESDNIAHLVVPPPRELSVALVDAQSFILETALAGLRLERLTKLSPEQFERRAQEPGGLAGLDVIVLDDYAPSTLPPGRYLSFGATPPMEGLNPFGEGEDMFILDADPEHPALRFVALDQLVVTMYTKLAPSDEVRVLAEGAEGPAIVELRRDEVELIHVTFDLHESNWPIHRSFITFIYNAVEYLGRTGGRLSEQGFAPGEAIVLRLPRTAQNIEVIDPDDQPQSTTVSNPQEFSWGPIRRAGLHFVQWEQPGEGTRNRPVAVNLRAEQEGNLTTQPQLELGMETVSGEAGAGSQYIPLWPYAIGAALLMLMIEWWIYHRKTAV